ncbi:hypothetical protein [Brucella anthropi]|uniref:hypothetical protein n=1 Tax=Brucella anthropi TaxID=529 RepID=UPI00077508BE|nr:hypothetical protein [Brucella anthropi]KXO77805.1 hypothetical protein AYJ56_18875 [Brucella anthropi]
MLEFLNRIDKNYAWGILGIFLAIGMFLYSEVFKDTTPNLTIEILSNESILDIKETLPDLKVLYKDTDIFKDGNTVSVIFARIINKGNSSIEVNSYDPKFPLQLSIKMGELVRADISSGSSEYLRKNTVISYANDTVILPQVIIEPSQWFIVKLFVLHKMLDEPKIHASGKITNQYEIDVVTGPTIDEKGFLATTFSGEPAVQIVRAITYTITLLGLLLVVAFMVDTISDKIQRLKRQKIVSKFKKNSKLDLNENDDLLFDVFISRGAGTLKIMVELTTDERRLQRAVRSYLKLVEERKKEFNILESIEALESPVSRPDSIYLVQIKFLMDSGLIERVGQSWVPVPERMKVAEAFINYAEIATDLNAGRIFSA